MENRVVPDVKAVSRQLERILASKAFQGSRRCQDFLRFVVEHAAAGEVDLLRERPIGVEVFGRDATYDKNDDSVVRVRATEVRRRLTQYYAEFAAPDELRIVLHPGSYVPEFLPPSVPIREEAPAGAVPAKRARYVTVFALLAALGAAGSYLVLRGGSPVTPEEFWRPLFDSRQPVLIVLSSPPVFTSRNLIELRSEPGETPATAVEVPRPQPREVRIPASEFHSSAGKYTGIQIAFAALQANGLLARHDIPILLRVAEQVTTSDLRAHPAVLIGGYSNSWVLRFSQRLRFYFDREGSRRTVRDRQNPAVKYALEVSDDEPVVDYAVISRLVRTETGRPILVASGMTQSGCAASAEIATSPELLLRALSGMRDWQDGNVQILARVRIIRGTASPPEILAAHTW